MPHNRRFPLITLLLFCSACSNADLADRAEALARSGDYKQAIELYDRVTPTSKDPGIFGNRGNCHSYLGNLDAAIADYDRALQLIAERSPNGDDPLLPMFYYNRGNAYERAAKWSLAVREYERTISLDPDYPDATNNLAWILATCSEAEVRNPSRAVELAKSQVQKFPKNADILDTLAAAYAAAGKFTEAITTQEEAISQCPAERTHQFSARLELYRAEKSYIEVAEGQ